MNQLENELTISTPGRICLFGEHQDYLNLPIIAAAISKRIFINGHKRTDKKVCITLSDLNVKEEFFLDGNLIYNKERDYFKSGINLLLRNGFTFSNGFECEIHGNIPINAGTSSSSALVVGWINFLTRISDQEKDLSPGQIAELAYRAEVLEFSEPGGMMDHYSTAVGGVIFLKSYPKIEIKKLEPKLGAFILGNSNEPKDTKRILARVKYGVLDIVKNIKPKYPLFDLQNITTDEIEQYSVNLLSEQKELLVATIKNRDITFSAFEKLKEENIDHSVIGNYLNAHHQILRDVLKISTNKIDKIIDAALGTGALGAKINGSGGGGCMFAYAPFQPESVLEAVKRIAPDSDIVYVDQGTVKEN